MGLLRTIFIIALIYFALKALRVYVFPILGRMLLKKAQEKMQSQFQQGRSQQGRPQQEQRKDDRTEGDVKVFRRPENDQKIKNDTVGDYVDFEEIE